jgi:hypothetical protein
MTQEKLNVFLNRIHKAIDTETAMTGIIADMRIGKENLNTKMLNSYNEYFEDIRVIGLNHDGVSNVGFEAGTNLSTYVDNNIREKVETKDKLSKTIADAIKKIIIAIKRTYKQLLGKLSTILVNIESLHTTISKLPKELAYNIDDFHCAYADEKEFDNDIKIGCANLSYNYKTMKNYTADAVFDLASEDIEAEIKTDAYTKKIVMKDGSVTIDETKLSKGGVISIISVQNVASAIARLRDTVDSNKLSDLINMSIDEVSKLKKLYDDRGTADKSTLTARKKNIINMAKVHNSIIASYTRTLRKTSAQISTPTSLLVMASRILKYA